MLARQGREEPSRKVEISPLNLWETDLFHGRFALPFALRPKPPASNKREVQGLNATEITPGQTLAPICHNH